MQRNGYIVSLAPNAKIAEELLNTFQFNLIILDILMSKERGLVFFKRKLNINSPVIMLTALGEMWMIRRLYCKSI